MVLPNLLFLITKRQNSRNPSSRDDMHVKKLKLKTMPMVRNFQGCYYEFLEAEQLVQIGI